MTEDNSKNTQFNWDSLLSRENLQMLGIIVVGLVVIALLANQTMNSTLRAEAAADVPGDIEDIGDAIFDLMEDVQEGLSSATADLSLSADGETFNTAITGALDEDIHQQLQTVGLYRPDGSAVVLGLADEASAETLDADAATSAAAPDAVSDGGEAFWTVRDDGVRYFLPLEADSSAETQPFIWVDVTTETLNTLMTQSANDEELFADTEAGYTVLVTADNTVIAHFNQSGASQEQITSLLGNLTEENFNEEEEYYEIESDPLIDASSFVAVAPNSMNDWQAVGAFPTAEVPNRNIVESTNNLFEASEVGDTVSAWVDSAVEFLNEDAGWLFRGLRMPIETVILAVEDVLLAIHWSIIILLTGLVAALVGGRRVAYLSVFGMFAIGLLGLWDLTMTTMAMLLTSMAFCILVGIPLGIWAASNDRVNEVVRSVLDAMQTIHPFVYLVPIVILFGIGKVPGTIATIIFALPPMVRLTNLGIRQVPEDVIEAARAFGSNDWQLLRDVQIPLAMPSIMAGVNQTLMLSLSMVVIVALIAGGGLGQEIYRAIQNSDIGRAVVSGVAVLLLAVVIDRISQGGSNPRHAEE